jgi:hypothetical protein
MSSFLDRVLRLWTQPLGDQASAVAAFRTLYADPLRVNGAQLSVADLVARARALQATYDDVEFQVLDQVESPSRVVVAFRMRGRHVGPLATPLGVVAPTGRMVDNRVIDVLELTDGLITGIWVVADELGLLLQLDAVRLAEDRPGPGEQ